MIFLHINESGANAQLFDKYVSDGNTVFAFLHMDGCGHCVVAKPEWAGLQHTLMAKYKHMKNIVIADVNSKALPKIRSVTGVIGFPTIIMISQHGNKKEDFENGAQFNKTRTLNGFMEWIELNIRQLSAPPSRKSAKTKRAQKGGKKTNKLRKSRKTRKSRTSRK
jgi:hypothetical protein